MLTCNCTKNKYIISDNHSFILNHFKVYPQVTDKADSLNRFQDDRYLLCDVCDGAFHAHCLRPQMASIPKNGWKCKVSRLEGRRYDQIGRKFAVGNT
jgi:hypothetical protein